MNEKPVPTGKSYRREITYPCSGYIYQHGLTFMKAGKHLVESGDSSLFTPGIVNICLAIEVFLKSLNSKIICTVDEIGRAHV